MKSVQLPYKIDPANQAASEVRSASKHVTSVSVEVSEPGSLDVSQLRQRLEEAERQAQEAGEDSEARRVAERDVNRWKEFLRIAEG